MISTIFEFLIRTQSPLRQSSDNCQDFPKGHRTIRNSQDVETADNMFWSLDWCPF